VSVSLSEHLPLLAEAPDGIKKLRGLILELAVRGKLVPQDSKDEPASELLKRIAAEKARLISDGKIKKDKPLTAVGDDEKLFELPVGWEWVRLGDMARDVQYGYTASANHKSRNVLLLRITDIQDDAVNWASVPGCDIKNRLFENYALENGDVVIARTGGTIGKSFLVSGLTDNAVFASYLIRVQRLEQSFPPYTKLFLGSQHYWRQLLANSMGTGQPNVNGTALKSLSVPLPPIPEQHRIVAKVDELMALCDRMEAEQADAETAHATLVQTLLGTLSQSRDAAELAANWQRLSQHFDTLFATTASLDALKQTVLQLAVMGKLVPQDPNDESASELLKRIAAEKARLAAEGKIRKDKPLPLVSEDEKPFELPSGWEWSRLQTCFDVRDGTHDTPKYQHTGFPLVTSKNIYGGRLCLENVKFISEADHKQISERSRVDRGDILFAMIGSIGNPVVVDIDPNFSIKNVALFKYYDLQLSSPEYLRIYLEVISDEMKIQSAGGVQSFVSLGFIRSFPFPLPPLSEQHRIVVKVDELMTLCDSLKADLAESRARQARLATTLIESALQAA
jgi:type I restriction enzyme S subunit